MRLVIDCFKLVKIPDISSGQNRIHSAICQYLIPQPTQLTPDGYRRTTNLLKLANTPA